LIGAKVVDIVVFIKNSCLFSQYFSVTIAQLWLRFYFSQLQQTLAAEALVGILLGNKSASRGREWYACTLALSGILVLTNKCSTATRTSFMFHKLFSGCFATV